MLEFVSILVLQSSWWGGEGLALSRGATFVIVVFLIILYWLNPE